MHQEEFTAAALRGLHRLCSASTVELVKSQTLKHADGRVDRRMRRAIVALAIPSSVGHLLPKQVVGKGVEPIVRVLEAGQDGEHYACDAGDASLASPAPSVVDAAIALKSPVQQQRASPTRLPVLRA